MRNSKLPEFIAALKNQENGAFKTLFSNFDGYAKKFYLSYYVESFGNVFMEEAVQEGHIAVLKNVGKFRGASWPEFEAFIKKIIKRTIVSYMRHENIYVAKVKHSKKAEKDLIDNKIKVYMEDEILNGIVTDEFISDFIPSKLNSRELLIFDAIIRDEDLVKFAEAQNVKYATIRKWKSRLIKKITEIISSSESEYKYGL